MVEVIVELWIFGNSVWLVLLSSIGKLFIVDSGIGIGNKVAGITSGTEASFLCISRLSFSLGKFSLFTSPSVGLPRVSRKVCLQVYLFLGKPSSRCLGNINKFNNNFLCIIMNNYIAII